MRYQRVKNVAWRRIGEETVIVNLGRRRMLAVNEAGGAVWDALVAGASALPDEASPFLADLEGEGIVERVAAEETELPVAVFPDGAPAVLWREEINRFGGACAFIQGQSTACDQQPNTSS
jgi:hypothetical protein